MAQQVIGVGSSANDGAGDPLRTAFQKVNSNFSELYGATVANVGQAFGTKADVEAATIGAEIDGLMTYGYRTVGDGGHGIYVRSASEPAHQGKIQSDDGAWWELETALANPLQFGAYRNGSNATTTTAAFNALFDYCFGLSANRQAQNFDNWVNNKEVYIPSGDYIIDDEIDAHNLYGFKIIGGGRLSTRIAQKTANKAVFNFDGAAYGEFRSLSMRGEAANTEFGLLHLDWTGTYPATLKPQQLTFADIMLDGTGQCEVGCWIAKSGGSAQSDTIMFDNCYASGFTFAAFRIGEELGTAAYNALSILFTGGNVQNCTKHGIHSMGGEFHVFGMSFQNFTDGVQKQMRSGGYDMYVATSIASSYARDIRSEGSCLAYGLDVESSETYSADIPDWTPEQAYSVGNFMKPRLGTAKMDGRCYVCVDAGTSAASASEPDWLNDGGGGQEILDKASTTASSTTVTFSSSHENKVQAGWGIWIRGAGAIDGDHYTTVASVTSLTEIELTDPVTTTATDAYVRSGPLVTDGTAKWFHWEFYAVRGTARWCRLNLGRVAVGDLLGNSFSRYDWLDYSTLENKGTPFINSALSGNTVRLGDVNRGATTQYDYNTFWDADNNNRGFRAPSFISYTYPIIFDDTGGTGQLYPSVGFCRGDGSTDAAGTDGDLSKNLVAVIGGLGKQTQKTANTRGLDLVISGGLGAGTGGGGHISARVQAPTTSGTDVPNSTEVVRIDKPTTAGQTCLMLWDVDNGTLERVTVGAADSGGTGFKVLRIPN